MVRRNFLVTLGVWAESGQEVVEREDRAAVIEKIDGMKDELVDLLVKVVKIQSVNPLYPGVDPDSVLGGEKQVNEVFSEVEGGFCKVDLFEKASQRTNCVGKMEGVGGGKSLILEGHVDTVPFGDQERWSGSDPLSGKITPEGNVYGRGSSDMKSGNVAMIKACEAITQAGYRLNGDVLLETVVGEETMSHDLGASACIERGYKAEGAIVTEPSAPPHHLGIIPVTGGALWMRITIEGKPAHVGMYGQLFRAGGMGDEVGVSAIDKGLKIMQTLKELEQQWGVTKKHPLFWPGQFYLMPGMIEGSAIGVKVPFVVPERCTIDYCIWYHPNETVEQVKEEVENYIQASLQTDPWLKAHPPKLEWKLNWPPSNLDTGHPIIKALELGHTSATGKPVYHQSAGYVSDSTFMNAAGIPTVIYGPGSIAVAHAYNEFVEISDMLDTAKSLALTAMDWCGYSKK